MWEQLFVANPLLLYLEDIEFFVKYRDCRWFMHLMMGLREDFESTRASLFSWSPTHSLDATVKELISKKNHWPTYHMSSFDLVLATPSPPPQPPIATFTAPPWLTFECPTSQSSKGTRRKFCCAKGHDVFVCHKL